PPDRPPVALHDALPICGPNFARFTARNLAARRRVSSERHAGVGDHPPVAPAGRAMREKPVAVVRAAPWGNGYLREPERSRLLHQYRPQVHMSGTRLGATRELR